MPKPARLPQPARNPFVIGHHAEGEGFCDRRDEIRRIAAALRDPSSRLLVYGDRRLGKSSAIHMAAKSVRDEGGAVVIVDLAVASNAPAAAQRILAAVHRELGTRWKDLATALLARLRAGAFSLRASTDLTGMPVVTFQVAPGIEPTDAMLVTEVLDAIEAELEERNLTLAIGLDEFQRLGRWYGDDVGWQLKEMLERHRRIAYVLAGSERSVVEQLLKDSKAALWKVVDVLDMQPVPAAEMARWISDRANATGVPLDIIVGAAIARLGGPRTRDIVQLARATWDLARSEGIAPRDVAERALNDLVLEQGALHQRQWDSLTDIARNIVVTLASDANVQLLAAKTLSEFSLGPKSTVGDTLEDLVGREVFVRKTNGGYEFDDPFFRRWVQMYLAT